MERHTGMTGASLDGHDAFHHRRGQFCRRRFAALRHRRLRRRGIGDRPDHRQGALEALAAGPIDVAILDINLAGTSVAPFAEHLRAHGIPFVFLTGYGDAQLLPEGLRDSPRFDKPVNADRLVRAMLDLTRGTPS